MGKIVLIILALLIGGGYLWFRKNSERVQEEGKVALEEGAEFGGGKPAQACLDEALRRLTPDVGIIGEALNQQFFSGCLETADVTPQFCSGVPPRDEVMKSAAWIIAKCDALSRTDQACGRLVKVIQRRCASG